MLIREIEAKDDTQVAELIRVVLTEFGANRPGFAWQDPELNAMSQAYQGDNKVYKVLVEGERVLGAGGIGPFECNEYAACCELQKMYFHHALRGKGWGRVLIEELMSDARSLGYQFCYLESLSSMEGALALYKKMGFKRLEKPLGESGHNACDEWWLLAL